MADEIKFDFSQVTALAADLGNVSKMVGPAIRTAVDITSLKVKRAAVESVKSGKESWVKAAVAIDYDITSDGHKIESEIGYDKSKAGGALGNLREFGAPNAPDVIFAHKNGKLAVIPIPGTSKPRPPHKDLANALDANKTDFVKGLNMATKEAEKKAGL